MGAFEAVVKPGKDLRQCFFRRPDTRGAALPAGQPGVAGLLC